MGKIAIMKYLKQFSTAEEYNSFISGSGGTIYLPNTSLIMTGDVVHFNDSKWNQIIQTITVFTNLVTQDTSITTEKKVCR